MQTWYITAATGGLGLALAKKVLDNGDRLAATSRTKAKLEQIFGKESEYFFALRAKL